MYPIKKTTGLRNYYSRAVTRIEIIIIVLEREFLSFRERLILGSYILKSVCIVLAQLKLHNIMIFCFL